MSNFLQRVAASVIQPQSKLRPILGSVFAPPVLRSAEAPLSAEAQIASQTFLPHRQESVAPPAFNASTPAGRDSLLPAIAQEEFSPVSSHRSPNTDQVPLIAVTSLGELQKPTQAHPQTENLDRSLASLKPAAAVSYQPLIAAMQETSPRLQPREPMPAAATIRSARAEAARRSQPAQREPDEIHIHIGRIEVAAIPQQAPRPAATAARRSLNLSDYLKHSSGRPT
jgi:hypothetical protein